MANTFMPRNGEIIAYELSIDKNHIVKLFITLTKGKKLEPKIMYYVGHNVYNGFNKWEYKIPQYLDTKIAHHYVEWYKMPKKTKTKQKRNKEFDWMN